MGRVIVGICGASGVRYGIETLRALAEAGVETHLILSEWAERVMREEGAGDPAAVRSLAAAAYDNADLAAAPSSSSFLVDGMVVIPASVKTVAEIAAAHAGSLIARAADNALRLRRPLVLGVRETPLSAPCLENLARLAGWGAVVLPLSPGFYHRPESLQDLYDFMTGKVLDCLGIANRRYARWRASEGAGEDG
jgi:4-hydroxy-3-polyprenylbenzoate decarboxylase